MSKHTASELRTAPTWNHPTYNLLNAQQCKYADGVEPYALHNRWTRVDVRYADRQVSLRTHGDRSYIGAIFGLFTYPLLKA